MSQSLVQIFVTGGSSTQSFTPDKAPLAGMGQALSVLFNDKVEVINHAITDRSSKSFIEEGRLQVIDQIIGEGDYLFVHFGHNDIRNAAWHTEPFTTYKAYIRQYIDVAHSRRAIPVLITPVCKREFNDDGTIKNTLVEYAEAVKQLGSELNVIVIDLNASSKLLYEQLGLEWTQRLFLWLAPGEHPNYPDGKKDNLHFNEFGASETARLVVKEIKDQHLPLADMIRDELL